MRARDRVPEHVSAPALETIYANLRRSRKKISNQPRGNPEEFPDFEVLAEAFARFHTDPSGLKAADAASAGFFENRNHMRR